MIPYDTEAYQLLHQGAVALAEVEANGIRVDTGYLKRSLDESKGKATSMLRELEDTKELKLWRKTFGDKTNFDSNDQLGVVLFEKMGIKGTKTANENWRTDERTLERTGLSFVTKYLRVKKLKKAAGTNLKGILREAVDGIIHPSFLLHVARTYRSSCVDPNFQNMPVRDFEIMQLVRRAIIARKGNQIVEIDFKGAEVCTSCCYHKDKRMIDYVLDKSKDMHRDMAMEIFKLPAIDSTKEGKAIRHVSKNMFVFPEFYGDYYASCADSIWEAMPGLKTASGPLIDHLRANGLGNYSRFEKHLQSVEEDFWGNRFRGYAQWKKDWYAEYQRRGWFKTLSGFICQGYMGKNQAVNYPIQGSAFHCLLWTLIRLVAIEIKKRGMKSLIIGQIHDSVVADVVPSELDDLLAIIYRITSKLLPRHWPWLIVPMETECEVAPVGGSWADKKEYKLVA